MKVDVLIPVLGRPQRVAPLVESLRASVADEEATVQELFLCTSGDEAELEEVRRLHLRHCCVGPRRPGDYARKINHGARHTHGEWLFLAADDLAFHDGWLTACLDMYAATTACVIGTNDLGNPLVRRGRHSTHTLVHRSYVRRGTIDEETCLLHEGYDHNAVDVEFVETAMFRGQWAFAAGAYVEHLHPIWKKGERDEIYDLGQQEHLRDRQLLMQRQRLWRARSLHGHAREHTAVRRREIPLR